MFFLFWDDQDQDREKTKQSIMVESSKQLTWDMVRPFFLAFGANVSWCFGRGTNKYCVCLINVTLFQLRHFQGANATLCVASLQLIAIKNTTCAIDCNWFNMIQCILSTCAAPLWQRSSLAAQQHDSGAAWQRSKVALHSQDNEKDEKGSQKESHYGPPLSLTFLHPPWTSLNVKEEAVWRPKSSKPWSHSHIRIVTESSPTWQL